jgi:hypothetical protein
MNKRLIKLTENDLHKIVKESAIVTGTGTWVVTVKIGGTGL